MASLLWSVTIPTYNASAFIEETLRSVLIQDPGADKMEIVVVDNCSTDGTVNIVKNIGKERIRIVVNKQNLGAYGNFNKCIEIANGELLHILNADDLVKPGFYTKFENVFKQNPGTNLVCCNVDFIDENGLVTGTTTALQSMQGVTNSVIDFMYINHIYTPAVVVRREAYNKVGNFDSNFSHVGDWEMWVRIIYNLKGLYIEDVLAEYREHSLNESAMQRATGGFILDQEKLLNKFIGLGYPITRIEMRNRLRGMSKSYYLSYYYAGNLLASNNMLGLFKKYSSAFDVYLLVARSKINLLLSKIKKSISL